ncbi:hypothetical protein WICPIJ_001213 [Wickerhamomyces pijperi]|uniref:Methyltransferase domain-containing protein n=1 Tax=Wickerhamomyces pijperi TaxID=599730 RepID=A0A9P8QE62_WICPI|nr:hypothetical protein WICPIJ_001213 [Wickerhamomyces pijperi]
MSSVQVASDAIVTGFNDLLHKIVDEKIPNLFQLNETTYPVLISFAVTTLAFIVLYSNEYTKSFMVFAYACFVKPFASRSVDHANHQNNLEGFYKTQAKFYDTTREVLLQGRDDALKLAFSHTKAQQADPKKKLVWVDIGGGTGLNIEKMDTRVANLAENFDAVYLVDLSTSLCEIAQERVAKYGWTNVTVICGDACDFELPHKEVDLITFSYSLSMIPLYHSAIDHAEELLNPDTGILAVVDFGIQTKSTSIGKINTVGGLEQRHIPWIYRTFWRLWFEFDKVYLDPSRREYLEYKFGTVKSVNRYNKTLGSIPYYIWLGVNKSQDAQLMYRFNQLATESPYLAPAEAPSSNNNSSSSNPISKALEAAVSNTRKNLPYPSLFYQVQTWRVYYDELCAIYDVFHKQYIYAFTWEDPLEDAKILNLTSKDTVLAITSAGDNLLSYACLPDPPRRIHGVDLNPSQGHLVELKLASITALSYDQMWSMFGEGKIDNFEELLTTKLAPHLSSNALQYWLINGKKTFDPNGKGLYDTGFSRWALRLARYVFFITGLSSKVEKLCEAKTIEEQKQIWDTYIRPVLYSTLVGKIFVGNPIFLWKALGVPANQAKMMGDSVLQYVIDTLDPVVGKSLISSNNYFYYLCLKGKYSKDNCPDYLTPEGFQQLKSGTATGGESPLNGLRLHTDFLNNVFDRLSSKTITVAVIMDHMDWFDPHGEDALNEIKSLHGALSGGGRVLLRTAALKPWYIEDFEKLGFKCEAAGVRYSGEMIDRVNMYASTWVCTKLPTKMERKMSRIQI